MAFNVFGFLIGRALAEREGIADQSSMNRVALVGGVVGSSATGLLVTTVLARREAESVPPTAPTPLKRVLVPDVKGKPRDVAEGEMKDLGLLVTVEKVVVSTGTQGVVIKQEPDPGEIVPEGSTVKLSVSEVVQPPEETRVTVPDVAGKSFTEARETLQDENFLVAKKSEPSSDIQKDYVIRTEPPKEAQVEPESRVTMFVSSGPAGQTTGLDVKAKK